MTRGSNSKIKNNPNTVSFKHYFFACGKELNSTNVRFAEKLYKLHMKKCTICSDFIKNGGNVVQGDVTTYSTNELTNDYDVSREVLGKVGVVL